MRELNEALMDRTTASHKRKHKIINIKSSSSNQDPAHKSDAYQNLSFCDEHGFMYKVDTSVHNKSGITSAPKQ
jgi:hypothetical protein